MSYDITYILCYLHVRRQFRLSVTILTHKPVILGKAENLLQTHKDLQLEQQEELVIYCPDCFDTMIKVYDSEDKVRYQCENCDLAIGEVGVASIQ